MEINNKKSRTSKNSMEPLKKIVDSLASDDKVCTYNAFMKEVLNDNYDANMTYNDTDEYKWIKSLKSKLIKEGIAENAKDERNMAGFTFKKEYNHYFANKAEKEKVRRMNYAEKTAYFTSGLEMLFGAHEYSSTPLIYLESVSLRNIDLIKTLAWHITSKNVIEFEYNPGFQKEKTKITLHPHILKEFNSRFFVFGYVRNGDEFKIRNFALDRIVKSKDVASSFKICKDLVYQKINANFYPDYFRNIVGVTRIEGEDLQKIRITTLNERVHNYVLTKPIHNSQKEEKSFNPITCEGSFSINVIPNKELTARLLSYGAGIRIDGDKRIIILTRNKEVHERLTTSPIHETQTESSDFVSEVYYSKFTIDATPDEIKPYLHQYDKNEIKVIYGFINDFIYAIKNMGNLYL